MRVEGSGAVNNQAAVNQVNQVNPANTGSEKAGEAAGQAEAVREQAATATAPLVNLLNGEGHNLNFQLRFSINRDANELVVQVIDPDTNEVIRQIPPEDILCLAIKLQEMLGRILDKKV